MTSTTGTESEIVKLRDQVNAFAEQLLKTDAARHEAEHALQTQLVRSADLNVELRKERERTVAAEQQGRALAEMCDALRAEITAADARAVSTGDLVANLADRERRIEDLEVELGEAKAELRRAKRKPPASRS